MTKNQAIDLFGGTNRKLAAALGIVPSNICKWPETLKQDQQDRVLGACLRLGVPVQYEFLQNYLWKNKLKLVHIYGPENNQE